MMRKIVKPLVLISLIFGFCSFAFCAEVEIERQVLGAEKPAFNAEAPQKIYAHSFYEYSWVKQSSRKGNWRMQTNRVAFLNNNLQQPYIDYTIYERLGTWDKTLDLGSYFKLTNGYFHTGVGFATDHVDFIYKFKAFAELEQKLVKFLYLNLDTRYLEYSANAGNVYIFSPSLVYYFGNNYLSGGYGIAFTESRGAAQYGVFKGNFALNERTNFYVGTALGERLFDIQILKASQQFGAIFFAGFDIKLTKNISFRLGGSYSKEHPAFIKRSIDFGAKIKF
jgi:YaiO family outer membrane protein